MDESMTSSSLDLAWPHPCQQCSGDTVSSKRQLTQGCEQTGGVDQWRLPQDYHQPDPRAAIHTAPEPHFVSQIHSGQVTPPNPAGVWSHAYRYVRAPLVDQRRGFAGPSNWHQDHSVEESLEHPLPLMSDVNCPHYIPPLHPTPRVPARCKWNMTHYRYLFLVSMLSLTLLTGTEQIQVTYLLVLLLF